MKLLDKYILKALLSTFFFVVAGGFVLAKYVA